MVFVARGCSTIAWLGVGASWLVVACASPPGDGDGADGDGEESGETGELGTLVCDEEWVEHPREPYGLLASHAAPGFYAAAGGYHIVTRQTQGEDPGGDAGWSTVLLPEYVQTSRMWASGRDDVWLVERGRPSLKHWDGSELTTQLMGEPNVEFFTDVWGAGPGDVWLAGHAACPDDVGPDCQPLLRRFDGETSTAVEGLPDLPGISSLWGRGPDDVFLGTQSGMTAHFDGSTWTLHPTGTEDVTHIVGDGEMVYAIGGTRAYRWYGEGWSVLGVDPSLWGFDRAAVANGRLWAADLGDDQVWSWDVTQWVAHDISPYHVVALANVDGEIWNAASDPVLYGGAVFAAIGDDGVVQERAALDFVPAVVPLPAATLDGMRGLGETPNGYSVAVFDGESWSWREDRPEAFVIGDAEVVAGGTQMWSIGISIDPPSATPELRHETPTGDRSWEIPVSVDTYVYDVWPEDADTAWVLGVKGAHRFDGESWVTFAVPEPDTPYAIATVDGHTYLRGQSAIYELINAQWQVLYATAAVLDMDVAAPGTLWLIERDDMGRDAVVRWDGTEWTRFELGEFTLAFLDARAPDDVYVYGQHTPPASETLRRVLHFDGQRWDRLPADDVWGTMAVADDGILLDTFANTFTLRCARE